MLICGWLLLAGSLYLLYFAWLLKQKGFDPSLITYANPLLIKGYWAARAALVAGAALAWAWRPLGQSALAIIGSLFALQIVSLYSFGRSRTQPVVYYGAYVAAATVLVWRSGRTEFISVTAMYGAAEFYLKHWQASQSKKYNNWVAGVALKIFKQYRHLAKDMTQLELRWTLHIATTEAIARPKIVRLAENLYFRLKKPAVISTGIMQVAADAPLDDQQSILQGARIIKQALSQMPPGLENYHEQITWMSRRYNGSSTYRAYLGATSKGLELAWARILKTQDF